MPATPPRSLLRARRVRWWHSAVVLVLLAGVLGAVFFFPGDEPAQRRQQGPPGRGPLTIVSMGDSTLSGEGIGTYTKDTNGRGGNWCHRSPDAAIHQTDLPGVRKTVNLACSGANSDLVRLGKARKYTEGSQAAQLREVAEDNRVAAIVVAVGANDDPHFSAQLTACAKAYWGGTPCT
ncbi:MAG: SGNH/GDSL hydrolase family protein, partial [Thermocrispum sp.]